MLVRLAYASRAIDTVSPAMMDSILATSRKNNPADGITGVLCTNNYVFLQLQLWLQNQECSIQDYRLFPDK